MQGQNEICVKMQPRDNTVLLALCRTTCRLHNPVFDTKLQM